MSKRAKFYLIVFVFILAGLACQVNVGGPEVPATSVPVSTEAAVSLETAWEQAFAQAKDTGTVTITITEAQLTSFLAYQLAEQEDPLFSEPQVFLQDGQIQIFGKATSGNVTATVRVVMTVSVDETGVPKFELSSADFGPVPVPEGLLSGLSSTLDEAFTGKVGPVATGLRIESIIIGNGTMAITGRVK